MISVFLFALLVAFLIFLYMRRSARRRKQRTMELDSVKDFHAAYDRIQKRRRQRDQASGYRPYVTKYNSNEDYRER